MNFFQKVGNAFSRFMYGRNGADHLGMAALWLAILLDIVNIFVKNGTAHAAVASVAMVLTLWAVFRMFSRNLQRRRAENAWFLTKFAYPCSAAAAPAASSAWTGPQILHLSQLPHGLPRPARKGQDRHHLPQVPPRNPRTELKDRRAPRQSRGAQFSKKATPFLMKALASLRALPHRRRGLRHWPTSTVGSAEASFSGPRLVPRKVFLRRIRRKNGF